MTVVSYVDDFGDVVTEYPPFDFHGHRIEIAYNPTGWRLLPPICQPTTRRHPGCPGPATVHIVRHHPSGGESQWYGCEHHLAAEFPAFREVLG